MVSAGSADSISANFTTRAVGVGRGLGSHAAQNHRAVAMSSRIKPIRDAGVTRADDDAEDAVGIDVGLVRVEAGLVAAVVDGLPPLVAERVAPVDALRRLDLEDQRFVRLEFEAADDRAVLRGGADRRAIDRRHEPVDRRPRVEVEEELQVVVDELPQRVQLARHGDSRSTERSFGSTSCRCARSATTTASRCPSRRRNAARRAWDGRLAILSQLPSCSSADSIASKLPSASTSRSSTRQFVVDAIPSIVCRPDVPCGPPVAEQPVRLTAAQRGTQVDAVGALHAPGQDVVGAGAPDREHRIGIDPQCLVDADREQHHQVAHPRCVVDAVAVDRI